jgi:predicted dinucleotide-binding enzyme
MKIGFLGAGNVTRTFGRHLINAGHTVVASNSRGPATLANLVADLGPDAIAGTREQAAESDVVILATHWVNVPEALKGIDWRGRILIDATNAHMDPKPDISLAGVTRSRAALKLTGRTSSEMVAEMTVGARLVKSISNMPMAWIQDFSPNKPRTVIFTSGRHRRCYARGRRSAIRRRVPLRPAASLREEISRSPFRGQPLTTTQES